MSEKAFQQIKEGLEEAIQVARSETLIPTMGFRIAVPSLAAYATQPTCGRLQQRFYTPAGRDVWRDVPIVEVPQ